MKRAFSVVLAFLLIAILQIGCSVPASFGGSSLTEEPSAPPLREVLPYDENGFYYAYEVFPMTSTLLYVDFATGTETPLCKKPGCAHTDDTCDAFFPGFGADGPFLWQGSLYYFYYPPAYTDYRSYLIKANPDGTNPQTVLQLPREIHLKYNWSGIFTDETDLYCWAHIEQGKTEFSVIFLKLDVNAGSYEILHEYAAREDFHGFVGISGSKFLISSVAPDQDPRYTPDRMLEFFDVHTRVFSYCKIIPHNVDFSFYNNCLYEVYDDTHKIVATNFTTNKTETYSFAGIFEDQEFGETLSIAAAIPFEGHIKITVQDLRQNEAIVTNYLLEKATGSITPFTLYMPYLNTGDLIIICAELGDRLLVHLGWLEKETFTAHGEPYFVYCPRYALMNKADYLNSIPNYQHISSFMEGTL